VNEKILTQLNTKYHKIVPFLKEVNHSKAKRYLEKKKKSIQNLLGKSALETQQIHELRKRLKIWDYTLKILGREEANPSSRNINILQDLLGKWHDYQVMIGHLEKAMEDGGINPAEVKQLDKVKGRLASDSEMLLGKINASISEHLQILNRVT
jgi:CHAD domain-containing protein